MAKNTITINGQVFEYNGGSISVTQNGVFVDGQEVSAGINFGKKIEVHIHGDAQNVVAEGNVTVNGHVQGDAKASGNLMAQNIGGDVKASGNANVHNVQGNVKASGSVYAKEIKGNGKASGGIFNW